MAQVKWQKRAEKELALNNLTKHIPLDVLWEIERYVVYRQS